VQPVLLRRSNERYQLIAGERRWRAARLAGLTAIPAVVRELGDRDALELALTENLLREDLNPIEAAHGYEVLQQKHGLSHEEIATRLGLDRSTVTNTLRLLRLPPEVQELISQGKLTAGHARAVLGLPESVQGEVALAIVKNGWSVREVENRVAASNREPAQPPDVPPAPTLDANVRAAVLEMERTLGTRVKIRGDDKRGKIEISYYSVEDLNRIYEFIVKR
jgi:ParB family chromosome partitioning protein